MHTKRDEKNWKETCTHSSKKTCVNGKKCTLQSDVQTRKEICKYEQRPLQTQKDLNTWKETHTIERPKLKKRDQNLFYNGADSYFSPEQQSIKIRKKRPIYTRRNPFTREETHSEMKPMYAKKSLYTWKERHTEKRPEYTKRNLKTGRKKTPK